MALASRCALALVVCSSPGECIKNGPYALLTPYTMTLERNARAPRRLRALHPRAPRAGRARARLERATQDTRRGSVAYAAGERRRQKRGSYSGSGVRWASSLGLGDSPTGGAPRVSYSRSSEIVLKIVRDRTQDRLRSYEPTLRLSLSLSRGGNRPRGRQGFATTARGVQPRRSAYVVPVALWI